MLHSQYSRDFLIEVVKGNIAGHAVFGGMGERLALGTTAAGEDIWRGNELAAAPTSHVLIPHPADAGEQLSFKSEHATDTIAGVGAQKVTFEYLDASGDQQTVEMDTNGTTEVDLTPANVRFVNDMYVSQVGTNTVAVGNIFVYKKGTAGLVYNMIYEGGNKSLVPHRMVPNGKTLSLESWTCSEKNNKETVIRIRADCTPAGVRQQDVFLFKCTHFVNQTTGNALPIYAKVPQLSVVKVSAWSVTAGGADTGICWQGVLSDN